MSANIENRNRRGHSLTGSSDGGDVETDSA